jgi:hypothetical protein
LKGVTGGSEHAINNRQPFYRQGEFSIMTSQNEAVPGENLSQDLLQALDDLFGLHVTVTLLLPVTPWLEQRNFAG